MFEFNAEGMVQLFTIVGLAIISVFFGAQKLINNWKSGDAESSIITLMHTELERMSKQNVSLSTELGRLHDEIILLNKELQKLTIENQRLQTEVCALTQEINLFKRLSAAAKGLNNATS